MKPPRVFVAPAASARLPELRAWLRQAGLVHPLMVGGMLVGVDRQWFDTFSNITTVWLQAGREVEAELQKMGPPQTEREAFLMSCLREFFNAEGLAPGSEVPS